MDQERRRKLQRLFHAALEQEPEARNAFLDVACGEDIGQRRQVELLLATEEKAGSFLETPALGYTTVTETATVPAIRTISGRISFRAASQSAIVHQGRTAVRAYRSMANDAPLGELLFGG